MISRVFHLSMHIVSIPFWLNFQHMYVQEQKQLSLSEAEMSRLPAIVKVLKETSFYHTSKLADADMALLVKILMSWPAKMIFPGIYPLCPIKLVSIVITSVTQLNFHCNQRKARYIY